MEFQHCFYESLLKIKKVSNTGILLLELDMSCYEETLLKLNMESANIFVRVMKKLLHLISIPTSILKGHVQDQDILSLDRQYVLQVMKLRSDYYRSDEVYQQLQDLYKVFLITNTLVRTILLHLQILIVRRMNRFLNRFMICKCFIFI